MSNTHREDELDRFAGGIRTVSGRFLGLSPGARHDSSAHEGSALTTDDERCRGIDLSLHRSSNIVDDVRPGT